MSKKHNQKLITPEILRQAVIGSFQKLNPSYMMKKSCNVCGRGGLRHFLTLLLSFPECIWGFSAKIAICAPITLLYV